MNIMVSVVIPTWNRQATVVRAVSSALAQTVPSLEVLVCDDGSSDGTREAIASFSDRRLKWLPGERSGGPAQPRNRGIRASRGEWLAFLDSDDEWLPEKLEKQLHLAGEQATRAVCSDAWRVQPLQGVVGPLLGAGCSRITFAELLKANRVVCSSMMVRRDVLQATSGFPEQAKLVAMEDYALWLRVAEMTDIAYVSTPLLNYTDDVENSLRREGLSVYAQRQRILENFVAWGRREGASSRNLWRARWRLAAERMTQGWSAQRGKPLA